MIYHNDAKTIHQDKNAKAIHQDTKARAIHQDTKMIVHMLQMNSKTQLKTVNTLQVLLASGQRKLGQVVL